jgi:hypothetical protein
LLSIVAAAALTACGDSIGEDTADAEKTLADAGPRLR